jgi:hypothetical protein
MPESLAMALSAKRPVAMLGGIEMEMIAVETV